LTPSSNFKPAGSSSATIRSSTPGGTSSRRWHLAMPSNDVAIAAWLRRQADAPYCANWMRLAGWQVRYRLGKVTGVKLKR